MSDDNDKFAGIKEAITTTDNPAAKRFIGMGFKLGDVEVMDSSPVFGGSFLRVRGTFTCICGRMEYFSFELMLAHIYHHNVYDLLVNNAQATSRAHLLGDGYTPAEIDAMEERLRQQ